MRAFLRVLFRPWRLARFSISYVWDLIRANALVGWEVLTPTHYARPGIVACPIRVTSDVELVILSNLISFTPGTLTLEISQDRRTLYVHALHIRTPDDVRAKVRRLEDRLLWVLR